MAMNKKPEAQIFRADAKGAFIEALNDCFAFGRHHLRFIKYDATQAEGSRIAAQVDIYLPVTHVARWNFLFQQGSIDPMLKAARETGAEMKVLGHSGGTGKKKLASSGRSRADGKAEFRALVFKAGTSKDFLLTAMSGPGNEDEKGLITPAGKMDVSILMPMGKADFYDLVWTVSAHYQAYLAGKYAPSAQENAAAVKEAYSKPQAAHTAQ